MNMVGKEESRWNAWGSTILMSASLLGCSGNIGGEVADTSSAVMSNGISNGLANGISNGLANGLSNGLSNGIANGLSNGISNGISNGLSNGISNGIANGIANGLSSTDAINQSVKFAEYLAQCALAPTQTVNVPTTWALSGGKWVPNASPYAATAGILSLATDWYTGTKPANAGLHAVSVCLVARMNAKLATMYFVGLGNDISRGGTYMSDWDNTDAGTDATRNLQELAILDAWLFPNPNSTNGAEHNPYATVDAISTTNNQTLYVNTRLCTGGTCPSWITKGPHPYSPFTCNNSACCHRGFDGVYRPTLDCWNAGYPTYPYSVVTYIDLTTCQNLGSGICYIR